MSAQNKDYVRDSEIDNILAQVQQKRASVGASEKRKESPSTRKSRDAELDEIMRGLGFEAKKPAYKEPILLPDPAESYTSEERESVRAQMNLTDQEDSDESEQDVSDVEPEQKDEQPEPEEQKTQEKAKPERPKPQIDVPLDDMEDEDKKEPITLELPSIKFFTETEAQKQEAERQRIMEQAVREARNTIHSSAQFAIQEEVRRRLTEMEQEKSLQEKKDQEMLQQEPDSVDHSMDGKRFGDVEVDDAFRNFFGTTVATDRAAMDEVTGRKRSFLSGILKKFQKTNEEESSEFPEEEIMGEPADVGVQEMPVQNASEEKSAPFNSPSIEFSPYSKWDSITLDLPKNKITPKDSVRLLWHKPLQVRRKRIFPRQSQNAGLKLMSRLQEMILRLPRQQMLMVRKSWRGRILKNIRISQMHPLWHPILRICVKQESSAALSQVPLRLF